MAHLIILLILIFIYPVLPNSIATSKYNILTVDFLKPSTKDLKKSTDTLSSDQQKPLKENNVLINKIETSNVDKEVSLAPPAIYYKTSELDQKPELIGEIDNNPIELRKYPQGGQVTIRLWLSEDGEVVESEIVKTELPEEFNKSALKSFENARFVPGIKESRPVKSVVKIMVQYGIIESTN